MSKINRTLGLTPVVLCSAAAALALPPVQVANVAAWIEAGKVYGEFDLELWSNGTVALASAELFGGVLKAGTIAATTFTVDHTTEIVTTTANLLNTGDGPFQLTTATTLPAGLSLATDYYWIALSTTTGYFASSLANALAGTKVTMTSNGTGTHTLTGTSTTKLMRLLSCGLLGNAADGVVSLTSRVGYNVRVDHRPNVLIYAIRATPTGAGTVFSDLFPVVKS